MSTLADRTISALRGNHDQLTARVSGLDEEDLARQLGSSQWDVAHVLSHLGSGAEIALAGLQAGIAGHEAPGQDFNQLVWDQGSGHSARRVGSVDRLTWGFCSYGDAASRLGCVLIDVMVKYAVERANDDDHEDQLSPDGAITAAHGCVCT